MAALYFAKARSPVAPSSMIQSLLCRQHEGFLGLANPQPGKSFVAGWITFIHRQQAFVAGDQRPRGVYKLLRIHLGLLHFQFRISGMSWPCLSMYCLCSLLTTTVFNPCRTLS